MANQVFGNVKAQSATGTDHGLLIESTTKGASVGADGKPIARAMVTIVGHDGKKRHASAILDTVADIDAMLESLLAARASVTGAEIVPNTDGADGSRLFALVFGAATRTT